MKLPQIIFEYSDLYEKVLKKEKWCHVPKNGVFNRKIRSLNKKWEKVGPRILREIANNTGLKWNDNEIFIYLTSGVVPYSDPITICIKKYTDDMIDKATHELIHAIVFDKKNWLKIKRRWQSLMRHYKNSPELTRAHIPVHDAVHTAVILNLFGGKRLVREKKAVSKKEYLRAWQIVDRDGYKNIIKKIKGI